MSARIRSSRAAELATRWGKAVLHAGGFAAVIYFLDRFVSTSHLSFAVFVLVFVTYLIGWLDGNKSAPR
jgi:hypothetical protein